jgi:hypothetical protein
MFGRRVSSGPSRAAAAWVRSDWRRRRLSLLSLTLLAGITFGVVGTVFAGARRTASSFDRLRGATLAYDHAVVLDAPGTNPEDPQRDRHDPATVRAIEELPGITAKGVVTSYIASLDPDWEFQLNAPDAPIGHLIQRDRVLRGRMPDPTRADEVAINEASVDQAHVDVGDVLQLVTLSPAQRQRVVSGDPHAFDNGPLGPDLHLKVVGVLRGVNDVVGQANPDIIATPAFDDLYRGRVAYSSRLLLVRTPSNAASTGFDQAVGRLTAKNPLGLMDATAEDKPARQTIRVLAIGLLVFALAAAAASILVVGQGVARHASGAEPDQFTLAAIGLGRAQRIRAVVGTVAPVALFGALLAAAGTTLASAIMPVGLARRVEPNPGVRFDPLVTGAILVGVAAVVIGAALLAAVPVTRRHRAEDRTRRPSRISASVGSVGAGPVIATGAGLAFDRRTPALPVRSALIGVGCAVVVVVAAVTFSASLDRLTNDHQRWGYGWDFMVDTTANGKARLTHELAADPDLDGVSLFSGSFAFLGGSNGIRAYGLERVDGNIGYALRSGVQPSGPDEVVVGPVTASARHLRIGDQLNVGVCPCTGDPSRMTRAPVRVVGIGLFPDPDAAGNFTDALGFSGSGFRRHVGSPPPDTRAVVTLSGRRTLPAVAADLARRYPGQVSKYSYPSRPGSVENLDGLHRFPTILAVFTALLGVAALQNVLVTTSRRRRREFATLRTLGFTPGQTSRCITWQSLSLAVTALVFGVPIGTILGNEIWAAATRGIGVATDADHPVATVALLGGLAIVVAVAISIPIGWRASRRPPAVSLHSE